MNDKWWQTSEGSGAMALRVKAFLAGIVPVLLLVSGLLGHPLTGDDINSFITQIGNLVAIVGTLGSAVMFIIGFARNFTNKKHNLGKYAEK